MSAADLLLPNADEARVLTGEPDPERAATLLARRLSGLPPGGGNPTTDGGGGDASGADGAVWSDGARVVRVPAEAVDVVDTTGAGDAFAAGLLAARADGAAAGGGARRRVRAGGARGGADRGPSWL